MAQVRRQHVGVLPDPSPGAQAAPPSPANLLLVSGVIFQAVHLQELLGHSNARQIRKDAEVTSHPKACQGQRVRLGGTPRSPGIQSQVREDAEAGVSVGVLTSAYAGPG